MRTWNTPRGWPGMEIIRLPIEDFSVPVLFQAPAFWKDATAVTMKIRSGERVFFHCGAGPDADGVRIRRRDRRNSGGGVEPRDAGATGVWKTRS